MLMGAADLTLNGNIIKQQSCASTNNPLESPSLVPATHRPCRGTEEANNCGSRQQGVVQTPGHTAKTGQSVSFRITNEALSNWDTALRPSSAPPSFSGKLLAGC
jgi:hypothetical protein